MLKRGKNRPSPAVLRAEMESQYGIRKTFGRRPIARAKCPYPGCANEPEPLFCPSHWTFVDGFVRRELLTELRRMRNLGQQTATVALRELFTEAIRCINAAVKEQTPA